MSIEEKIKEVLKNYPSIAAAYLFGSYASGRSGPMSDIDVAILFKKEATARDTFSEEATISDEIEKIAGTHTDIVSLNKSKLVFRHNVLRTGRLIYIGDEKERVYFTAKVISEFCDFEPMLRRMERLQTKSRLRRLGSR